MSLTLFYITNKPEIAIIAEKYGVNRIWIDLETIGKEQRQKGLNSVKSHHTVADIVIIKSLLSTSELMVRINPWHERSIDEIDAVVKAGADIVMLPMWKSIDEVEKFLVAIDGRVKTTLLLETKEAVECIDEVLKLDFDEIHIGLNDLHLSYDMDFMFELLSNGTVEWLCNKFKDVDKPYGFGGIAKIGEGLLPAEKIIKEHYRLGSTRAILSRTFCNSGTMDSLDELDQEFKASMENLRNFESSLSTVPYDDLLINQSDVVSCVNEIVDNIKRGRGDVL